MEPKPRDRLPLAVSTSHQTSRLVARSRATPPNLIGVRKRNSSWEHSVETIRTSVARLMLASPDGEVIVRGSPVVSSQDCHAGILSPVARAEAVAGPDAAGRPLRPRRIAAPLLRPARTARPAAAPGASGRPA